MSNHIRKSKLERDREKVIQDRLQALLVQMLKDEDNKYCVDCDAKGPRWASWNIGIFVCIRCAGIHRNLGVHISKVKSVNLDSWTPQQVASVQIMGNSRARAVYEAQVPEGFRRPQTDSQLETFIRAKYEKKKYMAREYVPTPAPDFPDGWTALIEAEKQKKDIRSIVLPSHAKPDPAGAVSADKGNSANEEQQVSRPSPTSKKEETVKSDMPAFDLLNLNNQSTKTLPDKNSLDVAKHQQPAEQNNQPPKASSSLADDLLGLNVGGNSDNGDFNDFVGAQPTTQLPFSGQQNAEKSQAMSKDSIMALFNQVPQRPTMAMPNANMMAPNIPTNFGLAGQQQQAGGVSANNPFANMVNNQMASARVPDNLFFGGDGSNNTNFLQ